MANFTKENLNLSRGGYETWIEYNTYPENNYEHGERKFVARFKMAGAGTFKTFLIKNFTVEEYFGRMDAGESPLEIAKSKGYILPHIKKQMKDLGYKLTKEGYQEYLENEVYVK